MRFSADNGATWRSISAGLAVHHAPVMDIVVDPVDPKRVYVATFGAGVWLYDWGNKLPACVP
ncbi:MAG: hypothetical protein HY744_13470 [Deltaproteobacteria bacterium]|nr:hypothetical protein [Deltaproteobacteria bacterium]